MTGQNRFLELLEGGEATLEDAIVAIDVFEQELATHHGVETRTCSFCGKPYVVREDGPVVNEQGRRSACWRRACRQELRAHGLLWGRHHRFKTSPAGATPWH